MEGTSYALAVCQVQNASVCCQRTGLPSRGIKAMRVPFSGSHDNGEPVRIALGRSKKNGDRINTIYVAVRAMSWIITGRSTPSIGVAGLVTTPSGPMIDQVRWGAVRW